MWISIFPSKFCGFRYLAIAGEVGFCGFQQSDVGFWSGFR